MAKPVLLNGALTAPARKFRPVGNRILVEMVVDDLAGSLVLPDNSKFKEDQARVRVVAVGTGRVLENGTVIPIPLEVGDRVSMVRGYEAVNVKIGGKEYLCIEATAVMGVFASWEEA